MVAGSHRQAGNRGSWVGDGSPGIWVTDLTSSGTTLIEGTQSLANHLNDMAVVGDTLFLSVESDPAIGRELYSIEIRYKRKPLASHKQLSK